MVLIANTSICSLRMQTIKHKSRSDRTHENVCLTIVGITPMGVWYYDAFMHVINWNKGFEI